MELSKKQLQEYMNLAIEEMRKSVPEPREDGKVNPKVGAVLVFPDGSIETAYRGELRQGDHAEYTLIERKCFNRNVEDAILFATLEPCVKRNPPKRGCCRRVTNARIKTAYVGIQDPDPTVAGDGIKYMEERAVKVIMFDREFQKIIEAENEDFLKGAIKRADEAKNSNEMSLLKTAVANADYTQLSAEALQKFITDAKLSYSIDQIEFQQYLSEFGALEWDPKAEGYRPTGTGILLFGINPRARFPQAVLKAQVNYGSDKIELKDFDQPLVLIPDLVEQWLRKSLPLSKDTSSFKRKDVPDFPLKALREALINALAHRDYLIQGAKSYLEIDNEKIIVRSPGGPMPSITLEQLNTFKAPSISRNPVITYVFSQMGYMEERGFGMQVMKSLHEVYGLPLPEYTFENPHLVLTFPRTMAAVKNVSHIPGLNLLKGEELKGYEIIKTKEVISRKDYEEHLGISEKTAERHLKKMVEAGLIRREGGGPNTRYIINF
jgi:ATP-dependent DNA helicase RecG